MVYSLSKLLQLRQWIRVCIALYLLRSVCAENNESSAAPVNGYLKYPRLIVMTRNTSDDTNSVISNINPSSGKKVNVTSFEYQSFRALAANAFSEIICHRTEKVSIRCVQKGAASILTVPRSNGLPTEETKPMNMELSPFGDQLVWQETHRGGLWLMSLKTKKSINILRVEESNKGRIFFFTLDWFKGLLLWAHTETFIVSTKLRGRNQPDSHIQISNPSEQIRGLTCNSEAEKLYWVSGYSIHEGNYDGSDVRILETYSEASFILYTLTFYQNSLYWIKGFGDLELLNSFAIDTKETTWNISIVTNATKIASRFLVVYEDMTGEHQNECATMGCSHICVPIYGKGVECACPYGLALVTDSICAHANVAVTATFRNVRSGTTSTRTVLHDLADVPLDSYVDLALNKNPRDYEPILYGNMVDLCYASRNGLSIRCLSEAGAVNPLQLPVNDRVSKILFMDTIQGRISTVWWLDGSGCLKRFSSVGNTTDTASCLTDPELEQIALDANAGIVFYMNRVDGGVRKLDCKTSTEIQVINGSSFFEDNVKNVKRRIAVDTERKRLYWLTYANLWRANYDGSDMNIAFVLRGADEESGLVFSMGRLYWIESQESGVAIVQYDQETETREEIFKNPDGTIHSFHAPRGKFEIHRLEAGDPCSAAGCSHFCANTGIEGKEAVCWCPMEMPVLRNGKNCSHPKILIAFAERNKHDTPPQTPEDGATYQNRNLTISMTFEEETLQWLASNISARNTGSTNIFSVGTATNRICWIEESRGIVCKSKGGEEVLQVPGAETARSPIAIDAGRNELLWGSSTSKRDVVCINVYSFNSKESVNITCFPMIENSPYAIDVAKKTIFWCGLSGSSVKKESDEVHVKILSSPSLTKRELPSKSRCHGITLDVIEEVVYVLAGNVVIKTPYRALATSLAPSDINRGQGIELFKIGSRFAFGLNYNNGHLFWIGGEKKSGEWVSSISTHTAGGKPLVRRAFTTLTTRELLQIKILQPEEREQNWNNPCSSGSKKCSHFCIPVDPLSQNAEAKVNCRCPAGSDLDLGGSKCVYPGLSSNELVLAVLVPIIILLVAVSVVMVFLKRRRPRIMENVIREFMEGNAVAVASAATDAERSKFLPFTLIICPRELTMNTKVVLGSGNFGIVYEGKYNEEPVAVKTIKPDLDPQLLVDFMKELKVMSYVGDHANITRFLGAEVERIKHGRAFVVLELSPFGSLQFYLRNHGNKSLSDRIVYLNTVDDGVSYANQNIDLTLPVLNYFGKQIAEGMAYLALKNICHGDLATRNVLVFHENRVKISDFGFARNLYQNANYRKKSGGQLPWRWSAPETLERYEFSTESDVWSYGVTLWEIYTYGNTPFPQFEWTTQFTKLLKDGLRPDKPEIVSEYVYNKIMMECWAFEVERRPTFNRLVNLFENV